MTEPNPWHYVEEVILERDRYRAALESIAASRPRPVLDPWNCEERLRREARKALECHKVARSDPSASLTSEGKC